MIITRDIRQKIIRNWRSSKMSLRELSSASQIPFETLRRTLSGTFNPKLHVLLQLCDALAIRIELK